MNSFLFIQSTRLEFWQSKLTNQPKLRYSDTHVVVYADSVVHDQDLLNLQNSPKSSQITKQEIQKLQEFDNQQLLGRELALVSYNLTDQSVLLARDCPGTETLYYYQDSDTLIVADQFSYFQQLDLLAELNDQKILEYLAGEFILGSETLWSGIFKVQPGEIKIFHDYQVKSSRLLNPEIFWQSNQSPVDLATTIQQQLNRLTQTGQNYSIELSGGLDSTTLASILIQNLRQDTHSYSVIFPNLECDESQQINNFLEINNHQNQQLKFQQLTASDIFNLAKQLCFFPEYPNSLSAWQHLQLLANQPQVLVDGFGGDQLFDLWPTTKQLSLFEKLKSLCLNNLQLRKLTNKRHLPWLSCDAECQFLTRKIKTIIGFDSQHPSSQQAMVQQLLNPNFSEYLESSCLLAKLTNTARSHPFLSKEVIALALAIPAGEKIKKQYLRNFLEQQLGPKWLGGKKADFSCLFQLYLKDPELQLVLQAGRARYARLLQNSYLGDISKISSWSYKQLLVNWNIIGLEMTLKAV